MNNMNPYSTNVAAINDNTQPEVAVRIYCIATIANLANNTRIPYNSNIYLFRICGAILDYINNASDEEKNWLLALARSIYEFVNTYGLH